MLDVKVFNVGINNIEVVDIISIVTVNISSS